MESLCQPRKFELQAHQTFLKGALTQMNKRVLLYHGLGSGKTCSAISIARAFVDSKPAGKAKVIVITPASLKPNFYKEMAGPCGAQFPELVNRDPQNNVDTNPCRENRDQIARQRARMLNQQRRVDNIITLLSYQEFVKLARTVGFDFKNTLVVVDEVQNIISATGSTYKAFLNQFVTKRTNHNENMRLILLSGTPVFDDAFELALIGNLLRTRGEPSLPNDPSAFHRKFHVNEDGTMLNEDALARFFAGKVSHFRGANPIAYPRRRDHSVKCVMSSFQKRFYEQTLGSALNSDQCEASQCFLIGPRQASNVVYPNNQIDMQSAIRSHNKVFSSKKHSCKFHECMNRLADCPGTAFVYSNFVRACGIDTFAHLLESERGYVRITPDICPLATPTKVNRFAIFRTGEPAENTRILRIFNSYENRNGDLIKVILGSPAMKEGVSLLRVRQVHMLDPYWNQSREEQVIGRAIRFCSHKDVSESKRVVDVYKYYAVTEKVSPNNVPNVPNGQNNSVDLHIKQMSIVKQHSISVFERVLKESAFDCQRFKSFNEPPVISCRQQTNNRPNANTTYNNNNNNNTNIPPKKVSVSIVRKPKGPMRPIVLGSKKSKQTRMRKRNGEPGGGGSTARGNGSCPAHRRPNETTGECPRESPHKRPNKKGIDCCYKRSVSARRCVQKHNKPTLKQMAVAKGVYDGASPITKKMLCELLGMS